MAFAWPPPPGNVCDWTFGVHSDDGFAFRIVGQQWKSASGNGHINPSDPSVITLPFGTPDSNTRGVITLAPGEYDIEFVAFEVTLDAYWELYAASGAFVNDADTTAWQLVGAPGGLELTGNFGFGNALVFGGGVWGTGGNSQSRFQLTPRVTWTGWLRLARTR